MDTALIPTLSSSLSPFAYLVLSSVIPDQEIISPHWVIRLPWLKLFVIPDCLASPIYALECPDQVSSDASIHINLL